jgi:hypothetical protein
MDSLESLTRASLSWLAVAALAYRLMLSRIQLESARANIDAALPVGGSYTSSIAAAPARRPSRSFGVPRRTPAPTAVRPWADTTPPWPESIPHNPAGPRASAAPR